ncbi:MAG: cellulose-binding domain-containing protein [Clostridiales bacterium]
MTKIIKKKKSLVFGGSIIILTIAIITVLFVINVFGASAVTYNIENDWETGAIVNVSINNDSSTTINGWEIKWTFPGNQNIINMWGADFTQNDSSVTVTNLDWNSTIDVGSTVNFGFLINYSGSNSIPSDIVLNGKTSKDTTTTPISETALPDTTEPDTSEPDITNPPTPEKTTDVEKTADVENPTDLSILPDLSMEPTVPELKAWVSKTYDLFPQFKELYETDLAMTKDEALAFHFADMSRESGKDGYWQMNLETGIGGAGHAWGPFQAAVTNFIGGGYDADILNSLYMPTPDISQFKVPNVSTYAGMKRLAEGIEKSKSTLGTNRTTVEYLLGTLAHHNTGHATFETITNEGWLQSYGNEVLRMMQGYLVGNHLTDNKAYWTTEPIPEVNGPWSGGIK